MESKFKTNTPQNRTLTLTIHPSCCARVHGVRCIRCTGCIKVTVRHSTFTCTKHVLHLLLVFGWLSPFNLKVLATKFFTLLLLHSLFSIFSFLKMNERKILCASKTKLDIHSEIEFSSLP